MARRKRVQEPDAEHIAQWQREATELELTIDQERLAACFNLNQTLDGRLVLQSPEEIARGVVEKQQRLNELRRRIRGVDPSWG